LREDSPCIDAADALAIGAGKDVAGGPRRLDGDLDGNPILDMGAYEYGHVRLRIARAAPAPTLRATTSASAAGSVIDAPLSIETRGTAGLSVWLFAGVAEGETFLPRFGALFVDLAKPWVMVPWGNIPSTVQVALPPEMPAATIIVQELALDAARSAGNTSNPVLVELR
jgi:hypothetical protein